MISFIVAKSRNNVIGSNNDLPWYLPADLKRFKEITTGHTVLMGRKTFQSILGRLGKPLPNRENIVLTRNKDFSYPGVEVINDLDRLPRDEDIHVIGGAEIYNLVLPLVGRMYITEVQADIDGDVYFPDMDMSEWVEVSRKHHSADEKNQYDLDFVIYDLI